MSALGKLVIIGFGAFLGYETLRALSIQQMVFSLQGIDVNQNSLTTTVTLRIQADNPTNFSNTLNSFIGALFANGQFLANVIIDAPVTLTKQSSTVIPVQVALSDLSLISILLSVLNGSMTDAVAELKGNVRVDLLPYPVDLFLRVA